MPGLLLVGQTCRWEMVVMPEHVVTVTEVLDGHVALDVQCLDLIYLNAYVPTLQTSAQVVAFLSHPGAFRSRPRRCSNSSVTGSAEPSAPLPENDIPWVRFGKDDV